MTAEFSPGQRIGDYEVVSILGVGGMGKVYKVRNVIADRYEAMKVLLPDLSSSKGLADRFLREIRLLASLNHPNIAALRTALTYENQLVMVMEFVEGETLSNRIARAPISTAEAVDFSAQVLAALSYAHKQNIIHRDIKPANIMLTPQGDVKLMDFGIARSSTDGSLTSTGTTLGSLNYMPPEQVRGEAADARSDIYSFGVSLYEMLTGQLPFKGDSQYSLMTAHLTQEPPAPVTLRADLPPQLSDIILKAMAKEPAQRFQSADEFREALKRVPVSALPKANTTVTPTPRGTGATTILDAPVTPHATMPAPPRPATPQPAPTVPMQPPTAGQTAQAQASAPGRSRWVALGVVLGIGALIAAAVVIPHRKQTHADQQQAMFPSDASKTGNDKDEEAKGDVPPVSIQTDKGGGNVDSNGNVTIKAPGVEIKADSSGNASITTDKTKIATGAVAGTQKSADAKGNPAPPAPAAPVMTQEDWDKLIDEADKLNIRAATVSRSIETLRQQQGASGYGLRADISSSQERMQLYMTRANSALQAHDAANTRKYLDLANTETSKLEKFLGH